MYIPSERKTTDIEVYYIGFFHHFAKSGTNSANGVLQEGVFFTYPFFVFFVVVVVVCTCVNCLVGLETQLYMYPVERTMYTYKLHIRDVMCTKS